MRKGLKRNLRTRPNSSRKVGLPVRFVRRTSVFKKKPTKSSTSARLRLAMGEPTTMSSWVYEAVRP